jgi:hypothetical protein
MPPGESILRGEKPQGGRFDFAWLVFDQGFVGCPTMVWLHRAPVVTSLAPTGDLAMDQKAAMRTANRSGT